MKAIICTKYGSPQVLQMQDVPKPAPKDHEALIKNVATTVTVADCRVRGFDVPASFWLPAKLALGFSKPRQPILGNELSGIVEAVGKKVSRFKVGDKVFAFSAHKFGAYSEYTCVDENACIALKPENMSFEQSAALSFGGITALHFLRKANIAQGDKILIYGASGSVGTYVVQIAKFLGAEVTGVCSSGNLELVRTLGADSVVDYTVSNIAELSDKFDVIFDTVGKMDGAQFLKIIKPGGRYIHLVAPLLTALKIRLQLLSSKIKFVGGTYQATTEHINAIKKMAEYSVIKPVIDRQYSFDEIASAHEYVDKGHKKGNVTIRIID
ncbi:MAG: NAD(P)-dependent alcohol dehydrogenase [Tannerellaceae bacterium]|jgi:NADPH:quinone reductase-like Zn-dependent oxidoreductase|nr:NAD(P)-dependent alcohol dehydrogenase [Tannerellaceae bacterium]